MAGAVLYLVSVMNPCSINCLFAFMNPAIDRYFMYSDFGYWNSVLPFERIPILIYSICAVGVRSLNAWDSKRLEYTLKKWLSLCDIEMYSLWQSFPFLLFAMPQPFYFAGVAFCSSLFVEM